MVKVAQSESEDTRGGYTKVADKLALVRRIVGAKNVVSSPTELGKMRGGAVDFLSCGHEPISTG